MCAPYSALQSYKFRVKLTPGSQRKGRAGRQVRSLATIVMTLHTTMRAYAKWLVAWKQRMLCCVGQAMELLQRGADVTTREKDLLRVVPETEVIIAMIGNVKLAMPGLARIKTEARRSKKKGKG